MEKKKWVIKDPKDFMCGNVHYQINGNKYYRVTKVKSIINNEGLNIYRAKSDYDEATKYMHARGKLGTTVHNLFQKILEGKDVDIEKFEEEIKEDILLFQDFKMNCNLQAESLEQHVWSEKMGTAGTIDFIGWYQSNSEYLPTTGRGKYKEHVESKFPELSHVIGDWKTSPKIYNDFWIQLASYVFTFEEQTGIKLDGGFIARFRDNKLVVEEKTYEELKPYIILFKHCIPLLEFTKNILPRVK